MLFMLTNSKTELNVKKNEWDIVSLASQYINIKIKNEKLIIM